MKISLQWLQAYFSEKLTREDVEKALLSVGIEIDEVIEKGNAFEGVVVAKIDAFEKHPDADKLSICQVNDGTQVHRLICGAKNFAQGDHVALATLNTKLPNGMTIKKAKIRGVESSGMLCSKEELGLAEASEGILILPKETTLGQAFADALLLRDTVFVLDLTPNRGDCLSYIGVAREISAALKKPLQSRALWMADKTEVQLGVSINDFDACSYYSLIKIQNVTVEQSPLWLQTRLQHAGVRPINNIVDITNYILMDRGQPLHAFDADKVKGTVVVRCAQEGEEIVCLDEVKRKLNQDDLVIADDSGAIAIAGVMGGLSTSVTESTKNVLLEAAWFSPQTVRKTSKRLMLVSESSKRFEREIDGGAVLVHGLMAAGMMKEVAGGQPVGFDQVGRQNVEPRWVFVKKQSIVRCLGFEVAEAHEILSNLGFGVEKMEDGWKVSIPSYRPEILREIDVIEEIARLYGYEKIPSALPPSDKTPQIESTFYRKQILRNWLTGLGLQETYTYSFGTKKDHALFEDISVGAPVEIANPITVHESQMRTTLLPSLLLTWKTNESRQARGARLFEISKVFYQENDRVSEEERLAFVLAGHRFQKNWLQKEEKFNFYHGRTIIENLFEHLGLNIKIAPLENSTCFHPAQSCQILYQDQCMGWMGMLHPLIAQEIDIGGDVVMGELRLSSLLPFVIKKVAYQPYSPYPFVLRDLAFVVKENVTHQQICDCVKSLNNPIIQTIELFDRYQGENVKKGHQSLAYRFQFGSSKKTLKDIEVDKLIEKIKDALKVNLEATLR